jgi:hypothetical protein
MAAYACGSDDAGSGGTQSTLDGGPEGAADGSGVDPGDGGGTKGDGALPPITGEGHIVYRATGGDYFRVLAKQGAAPENISSALDRVSPGSDDRAAISADGNWIALITSRFGCSSDPCLALAAGDLSRGEAVVAGGKKITGIDGRPGVGAGGTVIVYSGKGGPHTLDLFAVTRSGNAWTAPVLLTQDMTASYAHDLQLAPAGDQVVFDCGPDAYGVASGTSVCQVNVDGTGFRVVVRPSDLSGGTASHHPSQARDGTIVFEGDWGGEQIWKINGSGPPVKVSTAKTFADDNSPCVLPDGRIGSLWLNAPGNTGNFHELKVMNADGTGDFMLVRGVDIVDIGITCGN